MINAKVLLLVPFCSFKQKIIKKIVSINNIITTKAIVTEVKITTSVVSCPCTSLLTDIVVAITVHK